MNRLTIYICYLILIFQFSAAQAHPHSWVSVLTEIEGDNKQISGLKMFWTFDLMTTSGALEGEDVSVDNLPITLRKLANEMLNNIKKYNYYTRLEHQGKSLDFIAPKQALLTLEDYKLTLQFSLALEETIALPATDLALKVYEDTYYVDFLWLQSNDLQLSESFYAECQFKLLEPQTTNEQIAYASSLGVEEVGDSKLGEQFTQTAFINCY